MGRHRTDVHERVIALYRKGHTPADIARELEVSRQWISKVLMRAGIGRRAEQQAALAERAERVRRALERTPILRTVAASLGLTVDQVGTCLAMLGCQGIRRRRSQPAAPKRQAAEALLRQGVSLEMIVARGVASDTTARDARNRLRAAGELK